MTMVVVALLVGVKGVETELGGIMRQSTGLLEEFWSACFGGAPVPVLCQVVDSSVVLRWRFPTVETVQMQYIDNVVDVLGVIWSLVEAKCMSSRYLIV